MNFNDLVVLYDYCYCLIINNYVLFVVVVKCKHVLKKSLPINIFKKYFQKRRRLLRW